MTRTDPNASFVESTFGSLLEYLKSADLYSSKAIFRISRKMDGKSDPPKKRYPKSLGSIFGGLTSVLS